jgi:hypothetical protein
VAAVLLLAAGLRLASVGFGLPALNDPDEPLFVMTALEMLRDHTLNPGWFGHPGTTTLYGLALTSYLAAATGIVAGRFADAHAFVSAVYADPGIIFLPGRLLIVASGVVCVWLTYRIGTRIADRRIGLLAAFFLAINAVHIQYSRSSAPMSRRASSCCWQRSARSPSRATDGVVTTSLRDCASGLPARPNGPRQWWCSVPRAPVCRASPLIAARLPILRCSGVYRPSRSFAYRPIC